MEIATRAQILDEAAFISLYTKTLSMNPSVLFQATGK